MTLPIYNSSLLNAILHILQLLAQFECIKTAFLSHSFVSHLAHSLHLLFSSLQLTLVGSIARLLPSGLSTYPSSPGPLHFLENFVLHQALGHLFLFEEEGRKRNNHSVFCTSNTPVSSLFLRKYVFSLFIIILYYQTYNGSSKVVPCI